MLDKFEKYLESKGYSSNTPSGNPSTTTDYAKRRVSKICERENISLVELSKNISIYR